MTDEKPKKKRSSGPDVILNMHTTSPKEPVFVPNITLRCANCGQLGNPPTCFHGWGQSQLQIQHRGYKELRQ